LKFFATKYLNREKRKEKQQEKTLGPENHVIRWIEFCSWEPEKTEGENGVKIGHK